MKVKITKAKIFKEWEWINAYLFGICLGIGMALGNFWWILGGFILFMVSSFARSFLKESLQLSENEKVKK